jgi:hypothetical protein
LTRLAVAWSSIRYEPPFRSQQFSHISNAIALAGFFVTLFLILMITFISIRKDTQNWIVLAEYDLETARHMLSTGRYLYVIFMCHLSLEKMLKAHVTEVTQTIPI